MNEPSILQQIFAQATSMTGLEIAAVIFGILCVWQYVRESPWAWVTGTIQVVFVAIVVYRAGLYADFGLQILYVVLNGYGLYQWLYGGEQRSILKVTKTSLLGHLLICAGILPVLTIALAQLLKLVQPDSVTYHYLAFAGCTGDAGPQKARKLVDLDRCKRSIHRPLQLQKSILPGRDADRLHRFEFRWVAEVAAEPAHKC